MFEAIYNSYQSFKLFFNQIFLLFGFNCSWGGTWSKKWLRIEPWTWFCFHAQVFEFVLYQIINFLLDFIEFIHHFLFVWIFVEFGLEQFWPWKTFRISQRFCWYNGLIIQNIFFNMNWKEILSIALGRSYWAKACSWIAQIFVL